MATYRKRSGTWQARITWISDGKRHEKSKQGFKTKSLAQSWVLQEETKLHQGIKINQDISFVKYFDSWFHTYKQDKLSAITQTRYKLVEKELKYYFKDASIKSIDRQEYQKFINNYGRDHAPASVRKLNSIVRASVRSAILDDFILKDFTQNVTLTANTNKIVKVDYLSLAEIQKLVNEIMSSTGNHRYTSRYMILLAIFSGMRLSEIQALTWNDIDMIHQTITINKSWNTTTKSFKPTKNKSSNRTIKIDRECLQFIYKLKIHSKSNMVFMSQFGTVPTSNAVNHTLRSLLKKLGIHRNNFHFHSLRHSHVALLLANGIDLYPISKRLGHSNTTTTSEIYAYLIDEYKNRSDQQILNALANIRPR